jgi:F-type H+-transporting ATPase subunit epsilon
MADSQAQPAQPTPKKVVPTDQLLNVKVFSPYQIFYEGGALSVSAVNSTGPFDVLLNHANFFSLLIACKVSVNTGYELFEFPINHGIIKVRNNQVRLFVDV